MHVKEDKCSSFSHFLYGHQLHHRCDASRSMVPQKRVLPVGNNHVTVLMSRLIFFWYKICNVKAIFETLANAYEANEYIDLRSAGTHVTGELVML